MTVHVPQAVLGSDGNVYVLDSSTSVDIGDYRSSKRFNAPALDYAVQGTGTSLKQLGLGFAPADYMPGVKRDFFPMMRRDDFEANQGNIKLLRVQLPPGMNPQEAVTLLNDIDPAARGYRDPGIAAETLKKVNAARDAARGEFADRIRGVSSEGPEATIAERISRNAHEVSTGFHYSQAPRLDHAPGSNRVEFTMREHVPGQGDFGIAMTATVEPDPAAHDGVKVTFSALRATNAKGEPITPRELRDEAGIKADDLHGKIVKGLLTGIRNAPGQNRNGSLEVALDGKNIEAVAAGLPALRERDADVRSNVEGAWRAIGRETGVANPNAIAETLRNPNATPETVVRTIANGTPSAADIGPLTAEDHATFARLLQQETPRVNGVRVDTGFYDLMQKPFTPSAATRLDPTAADIGGHDVPPAPEHGATATSFADLLQKPFTPSAASRLDPVGDHDGAVAPAAEHGTTSFEDLLKKPFTPSAATRSDPTPATDTDGHDGSATPAPEHGAGATSFEDLLKKPFTPNAASRLGTPAAPVPDHAPRDYSSEALSVRAGIPIQVVPIDSIPQEPAARAAFLGELQNRFPNIDLSNIREEEGAALLPHLESSRTRTDGAGDAWATSRPENLRLYGGLAPSAGVILAPSENVPVATSLSDAARVPPSWVGAEDTPELRRQMHRLNMEHEFAHVQQKQPPGRLANRTLLEWDAEQRALNEFRGDPGLRHGDLPAKLGARHGQLRLRQPRLLDRGGFLKARSLTRTAPTDASSM